MTICVLTAKRFCMLIPVQEGLVTTIIMETNIMGIKTVLLSQSN